MGCKLQRFLHGKHGIEVFVATHASDNTCDLVVRRKSMRKMCEELLQAGLLQERTQAELMLSCSP